MTNFPHTDIDLGPLKVSASYPETEEVRPALEPVARYLTYCLKVKRPGEFAQRSDFSFELLRSWMGYIMILDYLPERNDFRYRMYGTGIAEEAGFDMTGRLVSDFQSETGNFFLGLYREAREKRAIVFSVNEGAHAQYDCDWHRVICPAQRDRGIQMIVCNYPQPREP